MVLHTFIARRSDGLPLSASVDDENQMNQLAEQKQQLKLIVRKINNNSEPRASIESGDYMIQ
jgi:vesicle transport protein SEC22